MPQKCSQHICQYIREGYVGQKREFVKDGHKITIEQITRNPKIGVMVSTAPGKVGFAIKSPKEHRNNWEFAKDLAYKRSTDPENYPNPPLPAWMEDQYYIMMDRSFRYFDPRPKKT